RDVGGQLLDLVAAQLPGERRHPAASIPDLPQDDREGRLQLVEIRPDVPVRARVGESMARPAARAREEARARARVRRRCGLLLRASSSAAGEEQDRDREYAEAGHATQDTALLRGNRRAHDLDWR